MEGRKVTEKQWEKFFDLLSETANVTLSAKACGLGRAVVYKYRMNDPGFAKRMDEASEMGLDAWEDELARRAFKGVDKPVFQSGKKVGVIREFDTTAGIFLLKGKRPERYRENVRAELTGKDGKDLPAPQQNVSVTVEAARRQAENEVASIFAAVTKGN